VDFEEPGTLKKHKEETMKEFKLFTVIGALSPHWPELWFSLDPKEKLSFLSHMTGYSLDHKQCPRAAVQSRDVVLEQFPDLRSFLKEELALPFDWVGYKELERKLGYFIEVKPLPPGTYRVLAGCEEHLWFKDCLSLEEFRRTIKERL